MLPKFEVQLTKEESITVGFDPKVMWRLAHALGQSLYAELDGIAIIWDDPEEDERRREKLNDWEIDGTQEHFLHLGALLHGISCVVAYLPDNSAADIEEDLGRTWLGEGLRHLKWWTQRVAYCKEHPTGWGFTGKGYFPIDFTEYLPEDERG